jgi:asparagine synthase (glutamine-hydrolysing)
LVPTAILDRKKQGFGVPLGAWFRGGLTDVFADVLGSARTRQRGYFEPAFINRIVQEHLSGRRDHTLQLWQLLVFELWHRHYLDESTYQSVDSTLYQSSVS